MRKRYDGSRPSISNPNKDTRFCNIMNTPEIGFSLLNTSRVGLRAKKTHAFGVPAIVRALHLESPINQLMQDTAGIGKTVLM